MAETDFGEIILGWIDSAILLAVAEQLDVDLPVETQQREADDKGSSQVGKLNTFIELGAERNFKHSVERASTFRQASSELRLARVLRGLLLQDRLRDLLDGVFVYFAEARHNADQLPASAPDVMRLRDEVAFGEADAKFDTVAQDIAENHDWVIVEGGFELSDGEDQPRLQLRSYEAEGGLSSRPNLV